MPTPLRVRTRFEPVNYCGATLLSTRLARREPRITLSLARIAYREHRGATLEQTIVGLRVSTRPDQWGNRVFGTVEYDAEGHYASYGGRVVDGRIKWQCYAD